jgi:hypothetical protein
MGGMGGEIGVAGGSGIGVEAVEGDRGVANKTTRPEGNVLEISTRIDVDLKLVPSSPIQYKKDKAKLRRHQRRHLPAES